MTRAIRVLTSTAALACGLLACSAYDADLLGPRGASQQGIVGSEPSPEALPDAALPDAAVSVDAAPSMSSEPAPPPMAEPQLDAGAADAASAPAPAEPAPAEPAPAPAPAEPAPGPAKTDDCKQDSDCAPERRCQRGACTARLEDAERCERDAECRSGRCAAHLCCAAGKTCCQTAGDCGADFGSAPRCSDPEHCQGSRSDAACIAGVCGQVGVDDDSGCDGSVRARECAPYADLHCNGAPEQASSATCPTGGCDRDEDCASQARCIDSECKLGRSDGDSCRRDSECASDHCDNGFCCSDGRCCGDDSDCDARYLCISARACQGVVFRNFCTAGARCEESSDPEPNSLGCFGQRARRCPDGSEVRCLPLSIPFVPECGSDSRSWGGSPRCEGSGCGTPGT